LALHCSDDFDFKPRRFSGLLVAMNGHAEPDDVNEPAAEWVQGSLGDWEPRWKQEPSLPAMQLLLSETLGVPLTAIQLVFLAQGAFNKVYEVSVDGKLLYVLRIALPVEPHDKTLSEVATLSFVREITSLAPRVEAYCAHATEAFPFEWILMERKPGRPLADAWGSMTWAQKEALVREVAELQAKLFRRRFSQIGSLYPDKEQKPRLGPVCSMDFIRRFHQRPIDKGPFASSRQWFEARLDFIASDAQHLLVHGDEDEKDVVERTLQLVDRIKVQLAPSFSTNAVEETVLCHHDLNESNLLIGPENHLTGVIDWEFTFVHPLWHACQVPKFLESSDRAEEPQSIEYDPEDGAEMLKEHRLEYEHTQLRQVFEDSITRAEPTWKSIHSISAHLVDLESAVTHCDSGLSQHHVSRWVDQLEMGTSGDTSAARLWA
jgi:aminoglycoside phosphotransferase (APT) family kinase protein